MLFWLALAMSMFFNTAPQPDTVLVYDPFEVAGQVGSEDTVLGWRRVNANELENGAEWVANVYLDLAAPDPATEPLANEQWALEKLGLARAWRYTTGSEELTVAVVDSGVDMSHPELVARLRPRSGETPGNGKDDDGNGLVDDVYGWDIVDNDNDPTDPSVGHGTEVAAVAVASYNAEGIAGVAPTVGLLPIRACTTRCDLFDVAWAVVYAVDSGADIINLSLGGFANPGPLADAIDYAEEAGVLVVAAAGNNGTVIDDRQFVPAGLPNENVLSVAATTTSDGLWSQSNRGVEAVDVGAPGTAITTATLTDIGSYRSVTGTSYATPYVAGTAALMLSVDPALSPSELIARLGRHGQFTGLLAEATRFGTRVATDRAVAAARIGDAHESVFDVEIVWLASLDITRGCNPPTNDRFCPERSVSRAEMAAFLTRALSLPTGPDAFSDDANSPFQNSINALAAAGITKGCNPPTNDNFCPDTPITRGEMAALLYRALA